MHALAVPVATFLLLARRAGRTVSDPTIDAALAAFDAGDATPTELGAALTAAVTTVLGDKLDDVVPTLTALLGALHTDLGAGADRDARLSAIRRASFGNPLPWLARIVDRTPDGQVLQHWVIVERFDDTAKIMDPNPWDDVEEERELPIVDFLVRWELAGAESVRL
jgi:hypothetical protein